MCRESYSKRTRGGFLGRRNFPIRKRITMKKKKKKEKKLVSNNSPLASFAVSTRAKISGIHLERDRFPSFSILRVIQNFTVSRRSSINPRERSTDFIYKFARINDPTLVARFPPSLRPRTQTLSIRVIQSRYRVEHITSLPSPPPSVFQF